MSAKTHLLSDAQMRDFIVNGYVTVNAILPGNFHLSIYEQTEAVFEKEGNPGNNVLPRIPAVQEIFDAAPVRGALASILGKDYYLQPHRHCHYNKPGSDGQNMHQDGGRRWSHHNRRVLALYYPQDTPVELGPTGILPGSHFYNTLDGASTVEELPLCGEAGSVTIVNYDLWHRAMPNLSDKKRYMMKFLFLRMSEPREPSWHNQHTSWQAADTETENTQRIHAHVWDWHCGKTSEIVSSEVAANNGIADLLETLGSDSEPSGIAAAYALREFGARAVPELMEALNAEPEARQRNACYALSAIGTPAVETLTEALQDPSERVRDCAAEALGDIGLMARPALPSLMQVTQDDDSEQVRAHAAEALGTAGQMEATAVPALSLALQDQSEQVRRNAVLAMARLGRFAGDAVGALQSALVGALQSALIDDNRYVRADAAHALHRIGTPEATKVLLEFLITSRWCPITTSENTF